MSDVRKPLTEEERQRNRKAILARTGTLLTHALDTGNLLFDQGDLRPFVELLSRFHGYNFYNILLIHRQCPNATHIASASAWRSMLPNSSLSGKPIELVLPYLVEQPPGTTALTWIIAEHYDVSQTNAATFLPQPNSYLSGEVHLELLVSAMCALFSTEYSVSVLYGYNDPLFSKSDVVGYRESNCLYCRPNAPKGELLHWLCTTLLHLANLDRIVGNRYKDLFCHLATGALLRIWNIEDPSLLFLRRDAELVRSVPTPLRAVFLEFLSRKVRSIEEYIHCEYQSSLRARTAEALSTAPNPHVHAPREESTAP